MDETNKFTDELARRRELANARMRRYRQKKHKTSLIQNEHLTDEMKKIKKQQIEAEKIQQRKELARERSRRYRERKRINVLETVDHLDDRNVDIDIMDHNSGNEDYADLYLKQLIEEEKIQQRRELARERSRKYREKKRVNALETDSQIAESSQDNLPFVTGNRRLKKESQAQASTSAATSSTVPKEEVLGTSIEQGVSNSFQISFPRNKKRKAPVKPFEIEFLPHFDPDAEKTETESQLREIKHEVNTEDYETFSQASFGPQYVKTEPLPEDPGCSSYTDTVLSSSEAKSSLTIKTECDDSEFDIEGRQYAEDLKSLLPEQRILVRKFVANIMSRAKMNLLTLDYLQEF